MDYREKNKFENIARLFTGEPEDRRIDATINEKDHEYVVLMKLIGFNKDELSIYIEANREDILDEDNDDYTLKEHSYSYCQRSFSLIGIDKSQINAYYENDIVSIHLPKIK